MDADKMNAVRERLRIIAQETGLMEKASLASFLALRAAEREQEAQALHQLTERFLRAAKTPGREPC